MTINGQVVLYCSICVIYNCVLKMSYVFDTSVEYKLEKETSDWMEGKTFGIPEPHN
jgi:hypothetical protein